LRGKAGTRKVQVDRLGKPLGVEKEVPSVPGHHLVTSIDARIQQITERALQRAMQNAPAADGGAAVVLDARTARVLAMSSAPGYDPPVWGGGISEKAYRHLLSEKSGKPLPSRAINGQFAPGSTFKVSSVAAMLRAGYPLNGKYSCPGSVMIGNRA